MGGLLRPCKPFDWQDIISMLRLGFTFRPKNLVFEWHPSITGIPEDIWCYHRHMQPVSPCMWGYLEQLILLESNWIFGTILSSNEWLYVDFGGVLWLLKERGLKFSWVSWVGPYVFSSGSVATKQAQTVQWWHYHWKDDEPFSCIHKGSLPTIGGTNMQSCFIITRICSIKMRILMLWFLFGSQKLAHTLCINENGASI